MRQLERGIFYEDSYLGVTLGGLVFSHGTIIIDAPLRIEDARSWRSSLLNQRGGSNRVLVNLDAHPDRTLGSRSLESPIIAHQKAAQVFRNRSTIFKGQATQTGALWEDYDDAIGLRWAVPDVTFNQAMYLHWGGPEVILEHHPGPAAGASWVVIPTVQVVFIGDAVVVDQPPFLAHADLDEWLATIELLQTDYKQFYRVSGRGGVITDEDVKKLRGFLMQVRDKLEKLASRNELPEATEGLVSSLLAKLNFPAKWREKYSQRLRYGLYQYYARHYRSSTSLEAGQQIEVE